MISYLIIVSYDVDFLRSIFASRKLSSDTVETYKILDLSNALFK